MTWAEINIERAEWTIPGSRAKNARTHVIPLPDLALEIIGSPVPSGVYVFTNSAGEPIAPHNVSSTMLRARKTLGLEDNPARPHDLRRTFASGLVELGIPRLTVSRLLNHTEGGVTTIYDRHDYFPEMRVAVAAWATRLIEITTGKAAPANVVRLERGQ